MNTIKALSFSTLLSLSLCGTAAAADLTASLPDLTTALQKQIETRMERQLGAELATIAQPEPMIIVRAESRNASHTPAS